MVSKKMLTDAEIERRLVAARDTERKARVRIAQLKRASVGVSRHMEMQRLCTLGRALMAWCERDERVMHAAQRFLADYISRDTDRAALTGTPWEVPAPAMPGEAPHG